MVLCGEGGVEKAHDEAQRVGVAGVGGEMVDEVNGTEEELGESVLVSANGLEAPVEEKRGNELIEQEELVHVRARRGVRDVDKHCGVDGWLRRRLTGCQHDAKKMPHGSE